MPRFSELDEAFVCQYRQSCPYLEGLPTRWVWQRYQEAAGLECQYEYQLKELDRQLDQARSRIGQLERQVQELQAQNQALHRRQFKGRKAPAAATPEEPSPLPKKRGAPVDHPPWQRPAPRQIDQVVKVPAPKRCPHCHRDGLQAVAQVHEHVQEDIVLQPRTVAVC